MVHPTPSSARVRIRPIRTTDWKGLSAFYERLSPENRFARFHGASRGIGDASATLLCGPDHEHREGFVAVPVGLEDQDGPAIVGHLCLEPWESGIEMAVAVSDEWQRQGVGRALLATAVDWATLHGIDRLQASILSTNRALLGLIGSVGCPVRLSTPSAGVVVATIDLDRAEPRAA
jgi:GNAT superfamily N-acetyltransferase